MRSLVYWCPGRQSMKYRSYTQEVSNSTAKILDSMIGMLLHQGNVHLHLMTNSYVFIVIQL